MLHTKVTYNIAPFSTSFRLALKCLGQNLKLLLLPPIITTRLDRLGGFPQANFEKKYDIFGEGKCCVHNLDARIDVHLDGEY